MRAYQLLDRGDLEALRSIYAEDVEMITPDEHIHGIEAALSLLGGIHTAFPDLRHELVTVIENSAAAGYTSTTTPEPSSVTRGSTTASSAADRIAGMPTRSVDTDSGGPPPVLHV